MQRLEENSERIGDCLIWTGPVDANGQARMRIEPFGTELLIHRAAWIVRHGEPPADTPLVLHRCESQLCWADEHLYVGSHSDMWDRTIARGRYVRPVRHAADRCSHGHLFDDANTYMSPAGQRNCRACNLSATKSYRRRNRVDSGRGRARRT